MGLRMTPVEIVRRTLTTKRAGEGELQALYDDFDSLSDTMDGLVDQAVSLAEEVDPDSSDISDDPAAMLADEAQNCWYGKDVSGDNASDNVDWDEILNNIRNAKEDFQKAKLDTSVFDEMAQAIKDFDYNKWEKQVADEQSGQDDY